MRSNALLFSLILSFANPALAGKKKNKNPEFAVASGQHRLASAELPGDTTSKSFAMKLVTAQITGFKPTDTTGATFVYTTLSFNGDNSWAAEGYVEIMDERMECSESGTWTMETAESEDTATMTWVLTTSDCAGRDVGTETRAKVTLTEDGQMDALFR